MLQRRSMLLKETTAQIEKDKLKKRRWHLCISSTKTSCSTIQFIERCTASGCMPNQNLCQADCFSRLPSSSNELFDENFDHREAEDELTVKQLIVELQAELPDPPE
ncbi:hypothetical protein T4B_3362 [Trichinella pseudospiralis]|uniref:Uncharacterized protein n=1 Tax=Trichinella pseudospiralis TaxID=6337 RepID=A0A0V1ET41_TRIPS|nr:hypothetical protein T4A_7043 [Trichinella pseudospiralis]KRZ17219.1 hypothetical protein T4B_3362 [Trichinella pseudospiralis]KRZ40581.1 hypothetical protein T4C_10516 [Trichinella pseudospiralis]